MKSIAILVPFKSKESKSRLKTVTDSSQRRKLAETMLSDVLQAIGDAGLISICYVVSSDRTALKIATSRGASVIEEDSDKGVNAAVTRGMDSLKDADGFLVLPSDLPLLKAREIRAAVTLGSQVDCVVSPSKSFDGTNLLIFSRNRRPKLSYDSNSFWNHVGDAGSKGLRLAVYCGRGVLFDVDSADDLRDLRRSRINKPAVAFARKLSTKWES